MLEKIKLLSPKQKVAVLFLLVIVIALPLFMIASQRSTEYRQRASESTTPFFFINPTEETKTTGTNFDVQLTLKNPTNVIAIDTTLAFDPEIVELVGFQPATTAALNSVLLKTTDNQKGIVRYAASNTETTPTNEEIGTLTFKPKKAGTTDLAFLDSKTMIRGEQSALKPTNNTKATYTITDNKTTEKNVSLYISPATGNFLVKTPVNLDIYLDTATNNVSGVSFVLQYDQSLKLERSNIDKSLFNNILKDTISQTSYTFAAVDTIGKTITGKTKLGTLTFTPVAQNTNATLSFSDVQITEVNSIGSISKNSYPNAGVYTIIAPATAPTAKILQGNANEDEAVNILDYQIWRDEYLGAATTAKADFNKDNKIDLVDFSIFRNELNP